MRDNKSVSETVKKVEETTDETIYYTFAGKNDSERDGYPTQSTPNDETYAKHTGVKRMIKIDDRGRFANPAGMYPQTMKQDRWLNVNQKVFDLYLLFLKTKNQSRLIQAEREAI